MGQGEIHIFLNTVKDMLVIFAGCMGVGSVFGIMMAFGGRVGKLLATTILFALVLAALMGAYIAVRVVTGA